MIRKLALLVIFVFLFFQNAQSGLPVKFVPPAGTEAVSQCVPQMGVHWAKPSTMPFGPIYVEKGGELVAIEFMIAKADFESGKSFVNQKFTYAGRELPIDHMDMEFLAQGHPGFIQPHYDIHFYLVSHTKHLAFRCP